MSSSAPENPVTLDHSAGEEEEVEAHECECVVCECECPDDVEEMEVNTAPPEEHPVEEAEAEAVLTDVPEEEAEATVEEMEEEAEEEQQVQEPGEIVEQTFIYGEDQGLSMMLKHPSDFDTEMRKSVTEIVEKEEELPRLTLTDIPGIVGITLSPETKEYFGIEDFSPESDPKYVWLNWKRIKLHIFSKDEESEFFPFYDKIKYYPEPAMLLGIDTAHQTGQEFFLCLTLDSRSRVLNPEDKPKQAKIDKRKKLEDKWNELASMKARKGRVLAPGSDQEVDQENLSQQRPLIKITLHTLRSQFGKECNFQNADRNNPHMFTTFHSEDPKSHPSIRKAEIDCGIQVKGQSVVATTQTGVSFKRNKKIQTTVQSILDEHAEKMMQSDGMTKFFKTVMPRLQKYLQQNEIVDLLHDDYANLTAREGHELELVMRLAASARGHEGRASSVIIDPNLGIDPDMLLDLLEKEEKRLTDWEDVSEKRNEKMRFIYDRWIHQRKTTKTPEEAHLEELENEDMLNNQYIEFLKYQDETMDRLRQIEPELPKERDDMEEKYDAIIMDAQQKQIDEDEVLSQQAKANKAENILQQLPLPPAIPKSPSSQGVSSKRK